MPLQYQPGTWGGPMPVPQMSWSPNTQYPQPSGFNAPQTAQPTYNNLLKVAGPESAKAFNMPPNSSAVMFDANEPIFYLVSTDDSGFKTMRTFDFAERADDQRPEPAVEMPDMSGYLSKDDAVMFATKKDLESIEKQLAGISKTLKELM